MSNPYLLLWLEAPLQSWGHDSKFGRRDSLDFPTKSGVLGLMCCARGAGDEEEEWLKEWASLDMQVFAYVRLDNKHKPVPREPMLRDFHMVGSAYDDKDPWQNLHIPKTSTGEKPKNSTGIKMTYRYYVQDMAYAVILETPKKHSKEVVESLSAPVWDLYLGRKCCVPTEFIGQGLFGNIEDAVKRAEELAEEKQRTRSFNVLQGEYDGEIVRLNDVPIKFGKQKEYRDRIVTVQNIN